MSQQYFSHNGKLLPTDQAVVPLDDVAYSYGFGVYETLRVNAGVPYFLDAHIERLHGSALAIELEHSFDAKFVEQAVRALVKQNDIDTGNVKILLIGGRTKDDAQLYIQTLNPLFPARKLYKSGVHCIIEKYERIYPHAKTLNMLPSYLIYRRAMQAKAYDALLINQKNEILEGTRTNFFVIKGRTIISPPETEILQGVMRKAVLHVAKNNGFSIADQSIPLDLLVNYDGAFLTSTSTKIMPITSIGDFVFGTPSPDLLELMHVFDDFYKTCGGKI